MSCCIILTRNPHSGTISALFEPDEGTIQYDTPEQAVAEACKHPFVQKWGGWVVDLDDCAIYSVCTTNRVLVKA